MRLKFHPPGHTDGFMIVETAICSASLVLLFALFITLSGYCKAYLSVKEFTDQKAMEASITGYMIGIDIPGIIPASGFKNVKNGRIDNLLVYCENWGEEVKITASYTYMSLLGKFRVRLYSVFTKWAGDNIEDGISVWEISPIERGKLIERVFGGGLPEFFPVIDAYDEITGHVAAILSVDTTLERYKNGTQLKNTICDKIDQLCDFTYGEHEGVMITELDIEKRELIVVIPENALEDSQQNVLDGCAEYSAQKMICLTIKRYQYASEEAVIQRFPPWEVIE